MAYTVLPKRPGMRMYGVWHEAAQRFIAYGLEHGPALSMRDRLNDQARRATSIAPPGHGR